MSHPITVACGFLGGTILSVEGGYRVLEHPGPHKIFQRIADARWFLAVQWCDQKTDPAAILTHDGQLSFQNRAVTAIANSFLSSQQRSEIFRLCRRLKLGSCSTYTLPPLGGHPRHLLEVIALEIDPRYGRVALVHAQDYKSAPKR